MQKEAETSAERFQRRLEETKVRLQLSTATKRLAQVERELKLREKKEQRIQYLVPKTRKPRGQASPLLTNFQIQMLLGVSSTHVVRLLGSGKIKDRHAFSVGEYLKGLKATPEKHRRWYEAWKTDRLAKAKQGLQSVSK